MDSDKLKHVSSLDEASFRQILADYGQELWNYAYALTRHRHDADDIVQDTFLKCHRSIDTFRGQSTFKTWLFAICRHTAFNARKSAYMRRIVPMANRFFADKRTDSAPSAEDAALGKMMEGTVWETLLRLPAKYREILVLDAVHELKQHEIAKLLDLSVGGVKTRLFRARAKMNELLKEASPHDEAKSIKG